jgi:hypothetical protein
LFCSKICSNVFFKSFFAQVFFVQNLFCHKSSKKNLFNFFVQKNKIFIFKKFKFLKKKSTKKRRNNRKGKKQKTEENYKKTNQNRRTRKNRTNQLETSRKVPKTGNF